MLSCHFSSLQQERKCVLVNHTRLPADGPNAKLVVRPWRCPFVVVSRLSPVLYCVRRDHDGVETSVQLTRMKSFIHCEQASDIDTESENEIFQGKQLYFPNHGSEQCKLARIPSVRLKPPATDFQHHFVLEGRPADMGIWRLLERHFSMHSAHRSISVQGACFQPEGL